MSKRKNELLYFFWSAAIVICTVLVLFSLIFAACVKKQPGDAGTSPSPQVTDGSAGGDTGASEETPPAQESPEPSAETPETSPEPAEASTVLGETEDMGQEYLDRIVFLGDSTTYGLKAYSMLSGGTDTTQVWTPASGTLALFNQSIATIVYPETGEEITIVEAVTRKQPEYLLITLGVNGVSSMDEEYFTLEYKKLVNNILEASPDTKIILNSIYPVASNYDKQEYINNEKITAANGWIRNLAEELGVRYLDSASVITGPDGFLMDEYQNGDGIHLNSAGFSRILEYIRTHGYQ
ncbi:MAG: SGNH/GDSL hydrolase family protein [Oscillospiraceae bacterium]|jgi:lysophospholipase L1-like esterase